MDVNLGFDKDTLGGLINRVGGPGVRKDRLDCNDAVEPGLRERGHHAVPHRADG